MLNGWTEYFWQRPYGPQDKNIYYLALYRKRLLTLDINLCIDHIKKTLIGLKYNKDWCKYQLRWSTNRTLYKCTMLNNLRSSLFLQINKSIFQWGNTLTCKHIPTRKHTHTHTPSLENWNYYSPKLFRTSQLPSTVYTIVSEVLISLSDSTRIMKTCFVLGTDAWDSVVSQNESRHFTPHVLLKKNPESLQ